VQAFSSLSYDEQLAGLTDAARVALGCFGIEGAALELQSYVNNAVFRATFEGRQYALRINRPGFKPRAWIQSELEWLRAIRLDTALSVPEPQATRDGAYLASVPLEGLDVPVTCVLFGWLNGEFLWANTVTLEQAALQGAFLARLHQYSVRFQPPEGFERPRLDWEGLFGERSMYNPGEGAALFTPEQRQIFAGVAEQVQSLMNQLGDSSDEFGLIHADFIGKNCLYDEGEIRLIDFDDCAWGYYLYDLAPPLLQFKDEARYADLRDALWGGYVGVRGLPGSYRAHLETFIAARHLASCRWLAGNIGNPKIRERAQTLIAYRAGELKRFLETGSLDEKPGGREWF
jgi:Ser/Thr protein kinase RdoA (MazF antagonist)